MGLQCLQAFEKVPGKAARGGTQRCLWGRQESSLRAGIRWDPRAHQRPESGEVREKNAQEKKKERLWVKCCAGSEDEGCSGGWMDWGDGWVGVWVDGWVDWRMDGGWMEG